MFVFWYPTFRFKYYSFIPIVKFVFFFFFFSSRRRHTRLTCDWSSDVCSSDLGLQRRDRRGEQAAVLPAEAVLSGQGVGADAVRARRHRPRGGERGIARAERQDRKSVV